MLVLGYSIHTLIPPMKWVRDEVPLVSYSLEPIKGISYAHGLHIETVTGFGFVEQSDHICGLLS